MSDAEGLVFLGVFWGMFAVLALAGIHWTRRRIMRDIPEMSFLLTAEDRQAMLFLVERDVDTSKWHDYALDIFVIAMALVAPRLCARFQYVPTLLHGALIIPLLIPIGCVADYYVKRRRIRRYVRRKLVELGIPVCVGCGYDLRGQTTPRCPECGRPFDPAAFKAPALTSDGSPQASSQDSS